MRPALAVLIVALLVGLATVDTSAQTSRRSKRDRSKQGPIKICRGITIPDGYTIVAETTSTACPNGAYLIVGEQAAAPSKTDNSPPTPSNTDSSPSVQPPADPTPRPRGARVGNLSKNNVPEDATPSRKPALVDSTGGTPSGAETEPNVLAPEPTTEEVGEGDIVRVETNLVAVPVSVHDRQGRFVTGLARKDFQIFENGVEQDIAYFEPTEKPFTVALLLDTSSSTRFHLWDIKEAAIQFARQLRPQDRVLVVTFNDEVLLLTEATNDQNAISSVINFNATTGSSTRLYDAVDLVIKERLSKISGRKAIVLFTDGVDTSSYLATYPSTIHDVEEFDALIYPIQYDTFEEVNAQLRGSISITSNNRTWPFPGSSRSSSTIYSLPSIGGSAPGLTRADYERASRYLRSLAEKSGGQIYRADDNQQLSDSFSKIAEELRRQYSLGFYPKVNPHSSGERRQLRVRVNRPDLAVRARAESVYGSTDPTK